MTDFADTCENSGTDDESMEEIREAALRILDYGDNTRSELIRKLVKKGYDPDGSEITADRLEAAGLVNDAKYAETYTEIKTGAGKGPAWIRKKLREKGVSGKIIDEALAGVSDRETERVLCLKRAFDICGLKHDFEIDSRGRAVPYEGSPYAYEKLSYFDSDEENRFEAYKERERAKAKLLRRLSSAGFSADAAIFAVSEIESL